MKIGRIPVDRIADMDSVRVAPSQGFPALTAEMLAAQATELGPRLIDPKSLDLLMSFQTYVLRAAGSVILVDACVGNDKDRPQRPLYHRRAGDFLERLAATGIKPEDVDIVLCTHLHADHVGWNTRLVGGRWVPTFPNARYVMAEVEFRHWQDRYVREGAHINHGSYVDSVLPVVAHGQADMVSMSHRLQPGICFEPAPGHTPGGVLIHVEDGNSHGVFCGDVVHHPIQFGYPYMQTRYCDDPAQAAEVRVALFERYADSDSRLFPGHFPAPSSGRILRNGTAYRFAFDAD